MVRIDVDGFGPIEVEDGTRLVRALEDGGLDMMHRCGGYAKCTTCRVAFIEGEPDRMTVAEHTRLTAKELLGQARLSCQILCDHDMKLRQILHFKESGLSDPGPTPEAYITPDPPEWMDAPPDLPRNVAAMSATDGSAQATI
ncbi:MAG TPA: 2Fe-2S iron-sulfur cluster-binding protein [Chloroflexia bacterium]|jgi:ferredoxin